MGGVGDLFDHLTLQDVVSFTGSAQTAMKLQTHPVIARESVRFIAERDSLNASILGPDAAPGTPEFDLFVKEVAREMTVKAGQKCTAIRRAMAPAEHLDAVQAALIERLGQGQDRQSARGRRHHGRARQPLAAPTSVREAVAELAKSARIVSGDPERSPVDGNGSFISPILLRSDDPWGRPRSTTSRRSARSRRSCPTATSTTRSRSPTAAWAASLCRCSPSIRGGGGVRPRRRRLSWPDGDPRPHQREGIDRPRLPSPGPRPWRPRPRRRRRGDGRDSRVTHYMQRTALQGSPAVLSSVVGQWLPGAPKPEGDRHPFRKRISELEIGYTLKTASRTVSLDDIEHFAAFTGDNFYAHMDEEAAKANPIFDGRVAHGYLILSFAAGLFVDPDPGPVLANYGLENLRFQTPLYPGDSMRVELTVKSKSVRNEEMGEVRWAVYVFNQKDEVVASYDLLTMNTP